MNEFQKTYALAKANFDAIKEMAEQVERDYIAQNNIKNADGSIPNHSWCIDNEETFERMLEDIEMDLEKLPSGEDARKFLKEAEDALIKFGLSLLPKSRQKDRDLLLDRCLGLNGKTIMMKVRQGVIDATFKLKIMEG